MVMPSVEEPFCCQECPQTIAQMQEMGFTEEEAPSCITNFPFFEGATLNPWTLGQAFWMQKRIYGGALAHMNKPEWEQLLTRPY